jgi:hypothetical protein
MNRKIEEAQRIAEQIELDERAEFRKSQYTNPSEALRAARSRVQQLVDEEKESRFSNPEIEALKTCDDLEQVVGYFTRNSKTLPPGAYGPFVIRIMGIRGTVGVNGDGTVYFEWSKLTEE